MVMNLIYYQQRIYPDHWEEFQQLIPENFRVEHNDFTEIKKQMAISPENQMSIECAWDQAAEIIIEKYNYDDLDEE